MPCGTLLKKHGKQEGLVPSITKALFGWNWHRLLPIPLSYEAAAPVEARQALLDYQVWDFVARISKLQLTMEAMWRLWAFCCVWEGADEQSAFWS